MSNSRHNPTLTNLTLITGGARSGKSKLAEELALEAGLPVIYIATMEEVESDGEAVFRIAQHRLRRPCGWETREVSQDLASAISALPSGKRVCLIDCLSLYVSNRLLCFDRPDERFADISRIVEQETLDVLSALEKRPDINFIVVTNEVGSGIVPENALARAYRDLLGFTNQTFAGHATSVFLTVSGLKVKLK